STRYCIISVMADTNLPEKSYGALIQRKDKSCTISLMTSTLCAKGILRAQPDRHRLSQHSSPMPSDTGHFPFRRQDGRKCWSGFPQASLGDGRDSRELIA
ncbi:MAG: hypothetical protein AAAC48_06485, partial [Phyllobacterium sp.]|uniref:hypothetical protein n=1 Tax=Phyllobacterium sp. TaxID=1871046 RepID=UPI0030F2EAB0